MNLVCICLEYITCSNTVFICVYGTSTELIGKLGVMFFYCNHPLKRTISLWSEIERWLWKREVASQLLLSEIYFAPSHKKLRPTPISGWLIRWWDEPDGHTTPLDPSNLYRYSGSAFIFQCSVKENTDNSGWVRRWKCWKALRQWHAVHYQQKDRERMKKREKKRRDVVTWMESMFHLCWIPWPFSNLYLLFCAFLFSYHLSHALLNLFVFLSNLHLSFTLLWPCLSHSELLHLYAKKTVNVERDILQDILRGSLCITLNPAVHWLTLLIYLLSIGPSKVPATENTAA